MNNIVFWVLTSDGISVLSKVFKDYYPFTLQKLQATWLFADFSFRTDTLAFLILSTGTFTVLSVSSQFYIVLNKCIFLDLQNGAEDVKNHKWFKVIDWNLVLQRKLKVIKRNFFLCFNLVYLFIISYYSEW